MRSCSKFDVLNQAGHLDFKFIQLRYLQWCFLGVKSVVLALVASFGWIEKEEGSPAHSLNQLLCHFDQSFEVFSVSRHRDVLGRAGEINPFHNVGSWKYSAQLAEHIMIMTLDSLSQIVLNWRSFTIIVNQVRFS